VSLFVDGRPQQAGASEFEQLVVLLAPVIADVPLAELSDEDTNFLVNELGLEQQPDEQQRIAWLRRCARLAAATGLPVEAFYGWGRLDRPMPLLDLVGIPMQELARVPKELAALPDGELRQVLEAAVGENIIQAAFRERIDEIIGRLLRRGRELRSVVAKLQDELTGEPLGGYEVTTFDSAAGDENRGVDTTAPDGTEAEGSFNFDFFAPTEIGPDATRRFRFEVVTPAGQTIPRGDPIVMDLNRPPDEVLPVPVKIPREQPPPFEEQLQQAQVAASPELLEWLTNQEIYSFADIRKRGGQLALDGLAEVDAQSVRELEALADLDRVSQGVATLERPAAKVSRALLQNYASVLDISDAPYTEFVATVADEGAELSSLDAARLHVMATVQTKLLNNLLTAMAADAANGIELQAEG
jgi:hypothetical protein